MTKRAFLRLMAVGMGAAVAAPDRAAARRILGAEGPADVHDAGRPEPDVARYLAGVQLGGAAAHGALTVIWLRGAAPASRFDVATLDEARARGDLSIVEREKATVPVLLVDNRGTTHVLLLTGEILVGGKQNRVVTEDVLLPPRSGPVDLAVYCVEQGRWATQSTSFESPSMLAAPSLRGKVMGRSDQGQVWSEVQRLAKRADAASPTQNYQAIEDKAEVKSHQAAAERAIDVQAARDAQGAAVFIGETLLGLDLFQDAGLFARQWRKLLRAYAVESYGRRPERAGEKAARARLESLLRAAVAAGGTSRRNAGAGRLFEFRAEGRQGMALLAEGQVVHAAIL